MHKKDVISKLLEIYEEGVKIGKSGFDAGVNYDTKRNTLYFKDGENDCEISKYNLADSPDVGDEKTKQIIEWSQKKN